jgi:tetratricopeptide (TPR) repeat protein
MRRSVMVLLVVFLFFLAGCATGPTIDSGKYARISGASGINIVSCDGKKVTSLSVNVDPGKHTVEMSYLRNLAGFPMEWSNDTCFLSFNAEGGHEYRVDRTSSSNGMYAGFITDRTAEKRVAFGCEVIPGMEDMQLKRIESAIDRDKGNANLWERKGEILVRAKRYDEAVVALDKATWLNPNLVQGWCRKSQALYELKKYPEAKEALEKADRLFPGNPDAVNLRKQIEAAMKQQ